jgi:uncharacterized protein
MEKIIGRQPQIALFEAALASPKSEFIAVTGRRRVGKTFLIKTFFKEDICFHFTGIQNQPLKLQLRAFTQELSYRTGAVITPPDNWLDAFGLLRDYVASIKSPRKKIIFLDELTWIDTKKSGFLQIFAHFWNSWAAWESNIILVIAGSSTSWIVNKVYGDTGGLHNRVTKRVWLEPFTLAETEAFFKHKNSVLTRYDMTLIYMAFGGVPFYLDAVNSDESAAQCIERLCFTEGGLLRDEFDHLYTAIFQNPEAHLRVVKTLANHRYGLERNDLLKQAAMNNSGGATKVLEDLESTGYIEYVVPYGKNSNSGKYILSDFYSRFYLNFISNPKISNWMTHINSPAYRTWCGLAFEWLCYVHRKEITRALGLGGIQTSTSYLNIKDDSGKMVAQIDMLIDRADNALNLCELKFSNTMYALTKAEAETIRKKIFHLQKLLKKNQSIFPTMITTFGCEKNTHFSGLITHQLDLNTLFKTPE